MPVVRKPYSAGSAPVRSVIELASRGLSPPLCAKRVAPSGRTIPLMRYWTLPICSRTWMPPALEESWVTPGGLEQHAGQRIVLSARLALDRLVRELVGRRADARLDLDPLLLEPLRGHLEVERPLRGQRQVRAHAFRLGQDHDGGGRLEPGLLGDDGVGAGRDRGEAEATLVVGGRPPGTRPSVVSRRTRARGSGRSSASLTTPVTTPAGGAASPTTGEAASRRTIVEASHRRMNVPSEHDVNERAAGMPPIQSRRGGLRQRGGARGVG